jgi:RNA polymerase sigma-70 factor (ECF subfamily)
MADAADIARDLQLARRAAGGDQASWRTIYEATCDRLFALLSYQVGNREDALDLLQETYLQAQRRLASYRGDAPLAAWLRAIALRKALDWRRRALSPLRRTAELTEEIARVEPIGNGARFRSERAALRRALLALSPQQRAALLLREWEGWSFREIAATIGCQENTARVHHTRAKERMRGHLAAARIGGAEALATDSLNEQRI